MGCRVEMSELMKPGHELVGEVEAQSLREFEAEGEWEGEDGVIRI